MEQTSPAAPPRTWSWPWFKKRLGPLLGLILALGIIFAVVFAYFRYPDFFKHENIVRFGYAGVFIISVILNATVIIPVSNMTLILAFGAILPSPLIVGIVGGLGGAIGEMTGYIIGRSGRNLIAKNKAYVRVEGWVKKRGWIAIFFLSAFPFVFDIVGIIAGALRMPLWRFLIPTWLGRTGSYIVVAYLGSLGFKALPWFGG
jgi:membrane protein YqaA with SNARE-associated domain